jgi:crotonobetainyl-CoA:carnitine CoA-transferase CaiB-like acyl-CoA transferase
VFGAGGREDLLDDPRFVTRSAARSNSDSLYRDIATALATNTTAFWLAFCEREGIPATRSVSLDEMVAELPLADHPHAGPYRVIPPPVRFGKTPASVHKSTALVGEHGASVLAEAGYSEDEIARMLESGALGAGTGTESPP